tara:strand:- start:46107 stop:46658 length:552 start_codon:yes stop_codon:yes gene_type:complete
MSKSLDEIFKKIYESELRVADEDLPRNIDNRAREAREEAEASVKFKETTVREGPNRGQATNTSNANRPLTLEEAEVVKERIDAMRGNIERINAKIASAKKSIIAQLEGNEDSPTFTMDIRDKPKLRKASKIVLGFKANEITFPMYRVMLEEKAALEKADTDSMFEEDGAASPNSVMNTLKEYL